MMIQKKKWKRYPSLFRFINESIPWYRLKDTAPSRRLLVFVPETTLKKKRIYYVKTNIAVIFMRIVWLENANPN